MISIRHFTYKAHKMAVQDNRLRVPAFSVRLDVPVFQLIMSRTWDRCLLEHRPCVLRRAASTNLLSGCTKFLPCEDHALFSVAMA